MARTLTLALLSATVASLLAGCRARDSSSVSRPRDTAGVTATSASRDSFFLADGTFDALKDVTVGDVEVVGFVLRTIEYRNGASAKARFVPATPRAYVVLTAVTELRYVTYPCPSPVIAPDTLSLRCPQTPIGEIRIVGSFLRGYGHVVVDSRAVLGWRYIAGPSDSTVVVRARVIVSRADRTIYDAVHEFVVSEGD